MNNTTFLQLKTYNESDNPSFLDYRKSVNDDVNSNMTKIDEFAESITLDVANNETTLSTHIGDTTTHVTTTDKTNWNNKISIASIKNTINDCIGVTTAPPSANLMATTYNIVSGILDGTNSVGNALKVSGFTVGKNVPSNAVFTDTITSINGKTGVIAKEDIEALGVQTYVHPLSHPATMITPDTTHRFVTDSQITSWDGKETTIGAQTKATTAENNAKAYTDTSLATFNGGLIGVDEVPATPLPRDADTLGGYGAEHFINSSNNTMLKIGNAFVINNGSVRPPLGVNAIDLSTTNLNTGAIGNTAFVEGLNTNAQGWYSHAQNLGTIAQGMNQTVIGKYNVAQGTIDSTLNTDYAFIVGNGTANDTRSNALMLDWDGNLKTNGDIVGYDTVNDLDISLTSLNETIIDNYNTLDGAIDTVDARVTTVDTRVTTVDTRVTTVNTNLTNAMNAIKGTKTVTFIIGTSTAGHTASDVDYLCDGTSDQTEINQAITALPATGGSILLKSGTYNLSSTISITKPNVTLQGTGFSTRIRNAVVGYAMSISSTSSDCVISNLLLDSSTTDFSSGNNKGLGIYIQGNRATVSHCHIIGTTLPIVIASGTSTFSGYLISDNFISDNANQTIPVDNESISISNCRNVTVRNNTILNKRCGIYLGNASNCTIENNNVNMLVNSTASSGMWGLYVSGGGYHNINNNTFIRGTGLPADYPSLNNSIQFDGTGHNLVVNNLISGKNYTELSNVVGNSYYGNKYQDSDESNYAWKYAIARYQDNVALTPSVDRVITIPYSTGGYIPKKIVLYSRETRDVAQMGSNTSNFVMEIVKEADGSFTVFSSAFCLGNSTSLGILNNVSRNAESNDAVFSNYNLQYKYGYNAFMTEGNSTTSTNIGYFSYNATGLTFTIWCNQSQYTGVDMYGLIY